MVAPGWWNCCARPPPRRAAGVPRPRPLTTCAGRWTSRPARRPILLELGLALARQRSPAAPAVLREAVEAAGTPQDHATAALLAARLLGLWGHHESVIAICRQALAAPVGLEPPAADSLEAELFANAWLSEATAAPAR